MSPPTEFRQKFRAPFSHTTIGIAVIDMNGAFVEANSALCKMLGFEETELLGQDFMTITHPEDREKNKALILQLFSGEIPSFEIEKRYLRKNGAVIWASASVSLIRNVSGEPQNMMAFIQDMTERKSVEQARNESDDLFRAIYDQAASGIMLVGLDGKWIDANKRFCLMIGYSVEELKEMHFSDVTYKEDIDPSQSKIDQLVAGEIDSYWIEKRYIKKNGDLIWIHGTVSLVRERTGRSKYLLAVIEDIQRRKQLEVDLLEAKEAAESASRLKTAFLANVSHEIRTPLSAILGFTNLLKNSSLSTSERTEYLKIIERSGKALTRVIDDVLDLSKVEAGRLDIEQIPFSLPELLEEVLSLFRDQAEHRRLILRLQSASDVPNWLVSDPTRIRQVLINIIGNALKFTSVGSVTINVSKEVMDLNRLRLHVDVVDTGIGIPQEQLGRLFQPFTQADNSMTRKFGGTGLGLVLSQRLARALGGDVSVTSSEVNRGSTFHFAFMVKTLEREAQAAAPSLDEKGTELPKSPLLNKKILVVDDSIDNRFLVRHYLTRAGATVIEASDGQEGVDLALSENFDLVLMDIQMPKLDGYQATSLLRQSGFKPPIIALTAHAMKEERDRSLQAGCNDHLTKPLDSRRLLEKISHLIQVANSN